MTTTQHRSTVPLRNALYELALAKPVPDAELVDEFARRYPEHAAALTEFAIELAIDAAGQGPNAPVEPPIFLDSPAVSRAMSRFQNRLYAVTKDARTASTPPRTQAAPRIVENPFSHLDRRTLRTLGERLNASSVFVMKLRDRQIDSDTMSKGFKQRVAEELDVPFELLAAHFAAASSMGGQAFYKADQKPEAGEKQTFADAVRSSGLSADQQAYLLSL